MKIYQNNPSSIGKDMSSKPTLHDAINDWLANNINKLGGEGAYNLLRDPDELEKELQRIANRFLAEPMSALLLSSERLNIYSGMINAAIGSVLDTVLKTLSSEIAKLFESTLKDLGISKDIFTSAINTVFLGGRDNTSLSVASFTTSPKKNTSKNNANSNSTSTLYNDAVFNWKNAPRMTDVNILSVFVLFPNIIEINNFLDSFDNFLKNSQALIGTNQSIKQIKALASNLKKKLEKLFEMDLKNSPIRFKSVEYDDDEGLAIGWAVGNAFAREAYDKWHPWFTRKPVIRVEFFNNNEFFTEIAKKNSYGLSSKTYYLEAKVINNIGRDVSSTYLKKDKKIKLGTDASLNPSSLIRNYKLELSEIIITGKVDSFIKQMFTDNRETLFLSLVSEEKNLEGEIIRREIDRRPVSLSKDPDRNRWFKISMDSLIFDFDFLKGIEDFIDFQLKDLLKFGSNFSEVLIWVRKLIYSFIEELVETISAYTSLFFMILDLLKMLDIHYIYFKGSYVDLPKAWNIVKPETGLIEELPNFVGNLVVSGPAADSMYSALKQFTEKNKIKKAVNTISQEVINIIEEPTLGGIRPLPKKNIEEYEKENNTESSPDVVLSDDKSVEDLEEPLESGVSGNTGTIGGSFNISYSSVTLPRFKGII